MAGKDNLIPLNKRTKEEQRKIAVKGGIASGEARRAKKTLRESLEIILDKPVTDSRGLKKLVALGIECENMDNKMLVAAALFKKAILGNVFAIKEVRSLIGEEIDGAADSEIKINIIAAKQEGAEHED